MYWVLLNYPNLHNVVRIDDDGNPFVIDLVDINKTNSAHIDLNNIEKVDLATFSYGKFACPGQLLAKLLVIILVGMSCITRNQLKLTTSLLIMIIHSEN